MFRSELLPSEVELQKITSSYKFEQTKKLEYMGFIDTTPVKLCRDSENLKETQSQGFNIENILSSEKPKRIYRSKAQKRKRNTFEDPSQARILNDDQRLKKLEEHLLKKTKKNDASLKPEQPKAKINLSKKKKIIIKKNKEFSSEDSSKDDEESDEPFFRGFHSSLAQDIKGLSQYNSTEDCVTKDLIVHTLYLPFSNLAKSLSCKKDLVIFQLKLSHFILDLNTHDNECKSKNCLQ